MSRPALIALAVTALVAPTAHAFELSSPSLSPGQPMPKAQEYQGFGCDGDNLSPALTWHDVPAGTKSFALTVYDPDAPTGSGWWHWQVYDIPAEASTLPSGAGSVTGAGLPSGAQQHRNDYGSASFGGACPPPGDKPHRYQFRLFALDVVKLGVTPDSSSALVGFMLNAHKLGVAEFETLYQR